MTKVAILPENTLSGRRIYRAVAGDDHSLGQTAGEALDALMQQLPEADGPMLVVVQNQRPSRLYTTPQRDVQTAGV